MVKCFTVCHGTHALLFALKFYLALATWPLNGKDMVYLKYMYGLEALQGLRTEGCAQRRAQSPIFAANVPTTELYYISGDCALIPRQSTNCNQKHGGFWPNLRHFDVTVSLFSCRTPLTRYLSGKNLSMSRGQWMAL